MTIPVARSHRMGLRIGVTIAMLATVGAMVGGNFWDMRATGRRLGNPAAEQAQRPPTNPVEMGLPDIACAVYRAAQRPYRGLFEAVWGQQAFAIQWPADVEQVCDQPGPAAANDPMPVHQTPLDRGRAATTFDQTGSLDGSAFLTRRRMRW